MDTRTQEPHGLASILKVLTVSIACMYGSSESHACSVHDHGCIHHALGNTVNTSVSVTTGPSTLHIYAIGTTPATGAPSAVDFDNKVLLPGFTTNLFDRVYYQPTGPYLVNSTTYGAANPPPDWNPGGNDGARQVYPSQYQILFSANTAQARHTGDLNGGENGNIPGATGCPNMPGAANCEAVVVTGNVPNGIYEQRVRIFNYPGVPNPQVNIQAGAYVTGSGVLVSGTHIPTQGGKEIAYFTTLTGTGAMSDTYKYEFHDRGFDPHASGVAWFDRNRRHMRYNTTDEGNLRISTVHRITDTTRTIVQGNGWTDQQHWRNSQLMGRTVVPILSVIESVNTTLLTGPGSLMPTQEWNPKVFGLPYFDEKKQESLINPEGIFFDYAEGGGGRVGVKNSVKGVVVDVFVEKVNASHQPNSLGNFSKSLYDYLSYPYDGFVSDVLKNENKIIDKRNDLLEKGAALYDDAARLIDSAHVDINFNTEMFGGSNEKAPKIDWQKGCSAVYGPTNTFGDRLILSINKSLFSCDN